MRIMGLHEIAPVDYIQMHKHALDRSLRELSLEQQAMAGRNGWLDRLKALLARRTRVAIAHPRST